jgi:(2Fe-2S) ferredoxin
VVLLRQTDRLLTARRRFHAAAARLARRLPGVSVRAAYVTLPVPTERSLDGAVRELVAAGAREIAIAPYQVEWDHPHAYDVPDALGDLAEDFPGATFRMARPLGLGEDLDAVVGARLTEAWSLPPVGAATMRQVADVAGQTPITSATFKPGDLPTLPAHRKHVFVCFGRRCMEQGSPETYAALLDLIAARGLGAGPDTIKVSRSKCLSPCQAAPVAVSYPDGVYTCGVTPDLVPGFVEEVVLGDRPLPGHTFRPGR